MNLQMKKMIKITVEAPFKMTQMNLKAPRSLRKKEKAKERKVRLLPNQSKAQNPKRKRA